MSRVYESTRFFYVSNSFLKWIQLWEVHIILWNLWDFWESKSNFKYHLKVKSSSSLSEHSSALFGCIRCLTLTLDDQHITKSTHNSRKVDSSAFYGFVLRRGLFRHGK